jgi:2'-5' RNA ligase
VPTIEALWDQVSAFEDTPSMRALRYPPHFTFAIYDQGVSEDQARAAIAHASAGETAVAITFDRIRIFSGPPLVLWAAPAPVDSLVRMHSAIHAVIEPSLCRPHYRPGAWTPHCTLATRVREDLRADALAFTKNFRSEVETVFDVLDCVAFPPLRAVAQQRLHLSV